MMCEDDECHVMVPAAPEAQLIVVHAQFSFALGKTRLDWPAHPAHTHESREGCFDGSITQVELPFRLRGFTADFAPDHHPDLRAWQAITRQHGAQYEEIGDQRAFMPLKPPKPLPGGRGPLPGQFLHRHFGRARGMQTLAPGGGSFMRAGLGRHPTAWTPTFRLPIGLTPRPDLGVPRNLPQAPQSRPRPAFQAGGPVPI